MKIKVVDRAYHICIALLPLLCLINIPVVHISLGTIILLGFIPFSLNAVKNCVKYDQVRVSSIFIFAFYAYMILRADGSTARMVFCAAAYIHLLGMCCGSIRSEELRKIIETFAIINCGLIILQVLSYYGLHYRIQYIPKALVHTDFQESYVFQEVKGLYRPSAVFLEPAHYSQYCCFALISTLFPDGRKADLKKAAIIAAGCLLTTSGMGIALTFCICAWYVVVNNGLKRIRLIDLMRWIPVIVVGLFVLSRIPFFRTAVQRVFSNVDGYNAISGRTKQWNAAIGPMRGSVLLLGYGNSAKFPYYLAGLADTIYKTGLFGVFLQFCCFIYMVLKKPGNFVICCSIAFNLLFCFSHLTSVYEQVFYLGIVVADVLNSNRIRTVRFVWEKN